MKPHKKQTLFTFIGILFVISCVKMAADYRYVVRKEGRYKVIKDTTYIGHVNDTIK